MRYMFGINLGELASPENRGTLKLAIYELLYLLGKASPRDSPGPWVPVNGGQPMAISDLAKHFDLSESGLYNNLRLLEIKGYIRRRPASHGVCIELSSRLFSPGELYSQLQNSENPGIQESGNPGTQENARHSGAPLGPPLPRSPSPPISPNEAKTKDIPPNGGKSPPAPSEPQFPQEVHDLVNALHNFLDVRGALPPQKRRTSWRMSNLHFANKQMFDPAEDMQAQLKQWLDCLSWAGAQPYWADKITGLSKLVAVWSEYQLQKNAGERRPAPSRQVPRKSNVFLQRERKDDDYYDYIHKKFEKGTET